MSLKDKDPNSYQVGGDHYTGESVQHWDVMWYVEGSAHFRANITKYLSRFHKKNGKQDVQKSLQYAHKWFQCLTNNFPSLRHEEQVIGNRTLILLFVDQWFTSIKWPKGKTFAEVRVIIEAAFTAQTASEVEGVHTMISVLLDRYDDLNTTIQEEYSASKADGSEPTSAYTNQDRVLKGIDEITARAKSMAGEARSMIHQVLDTAQEKFTQTMEEGSKSIGQTLYDLIPRLKVFRLSPLVTIPQYAKEGDAGMDVSAFLTDKHSDVPQNNHQDDPVTWKLDPGERRLIPTGLHLAIPEGFMIQVCSRSGLAAKNGVVSLISPGIIDSGYRGELKVCLYNSGNERFLVRDGDRIAQLILQRTPKLDIEEVDSLEHLGTTDRGHGGFGSTGTAQ